MNCQQVQNYLDNLLVTGPRESLEKDLEAHVANCPGCAEQYELARETLASLQPSHTIQASTAVRERIMERVIELDALDARGRTPHAAWEWNFGWRRPLYVLAMAASLVIAASVFHWIKGPNPGVTRLPALGLLTQAMAAEEAIFKGDTVVHVVNEIVLPAVPDATLAGLRWIPVGSLEASGQARFHQLALGTKPGESFTVSDQAWYDPATGRFVRRMERAGRLLFANSYDGKVICAPVKELGGAVQLVATTATQSFRAPAKPAEFLGIAAGLPFKVDPASSDTVSEVGPVALADGTVGRVLKVGFDKESPAGLNDSYLLFTIHEHTNTIAQIEWKAQGQSLLVIRRVKTETVPAATVTWNLAGAKLESPGAAPGPVTGISPDMVIPNASLAQMVARADFETYTFAKKPAWTTDVNLTDILDVASPPHRMFAIACRATDGRHVVLVQSYTYNVTLGPLVKTGRVVYESPKGFRVWSGPRDKWLAGILLQSARFVIKDPASEDRVGYMIETPAGTFPALAVNGKVTEQELRELVDSLVPAKDLVRK